MNLGEEEQEAQQGGHQPQVAAIANENRLDASLNEKSDDHDSNDDNRAAVNVTPVGPSENNVIQCPRCARVFELQQGLRSHALTCDGNQPICDLCGKDCLKRSKLEDHWFYCPLRSPSEIESKKIACKKCGGRCTHYDLHKHGKICRGVDWSSLECAHCSYIASNAGNLSNHYKKGCVGLHPKLAMKLRYKCQYCDFHAKCNYKYASARRNMPETKEDGRTVPFKRS